MGRVFQLGHLVILADKILLVEYIHLMMKE